MTDFKEQHMSIKFCFKLGNTAVGTYDILKHALRLKEQIIVFQTFKLFLKLKN